MSCTYVFCRGDKKGEVCGVTLRSATSKSQGLCSVHCAKTKERNLVACRKLAEETKERLFRVEVDNANHAIFKKHPEGKVVKIVHQTRALQLQKLGAKITPIGTGSVADLVEA